MWQTVFFVYWSRDKKEFMIANGRVAPACREMVNGVDMARASGGDTRAGVHASAIVSCVARGFGV